MSDPFLLFQMPRHAVVKRVWDYCKENNLMVSVFTFRVTRFVRRKGREDRKKQKREGEEKKERRKREKDKNIKREANEQKRRKRSKERTNRKQGREAKERRENRVGLDVSFTFQTTFSFDSNVHLIQNFFLSCYNLLIFSVSFSSFRILAINNLQSVMKNYNVS